MHSAVAYAPAVLVRELAALPNVSCKLSGMITEAGGPGWKVADLRS